MIHPRTVLVGLVATLGMLLVAVAVSIGLERLFSAEVPPDPPIEGITLPPASDEEVAHITATIFYATSDGTSIAGVRREVPLGDGRVEQGRQLLMLALAPPPPGYLSPIPPGTTLRAFYVTERGEAFVDLGGDVARAHPGGAHAELLTASAIVNTIAANLPAVQRVQILVEGRPVDTLAGHIDLRSPLTREDLQVP